MRKPTLANLFSCALEKHGTQCEVARRCGISQAMVSLYLSGKVRTVKAGSILRIAHCLGVKPAVVLAACVKNGSTVN